MSSPSYGDRFRDPTCFPPTPFPGCWDSSAIPAVYPPVEIDGRFYMDGGVVNNTPLSYAVALGADRVWVLPTGYSCALTTPPRGALAMALHALNLAINQRLALDITRFEGSVDLHVIPQPCPLGVSPVDFSHAAELVERSYVGARKWLSKPRPATGQASLLGLHRH